MAELIKAELEEEEDNQKGKFMIFQTGNEYYGISISYVNQIVVMQPITGVPEAEDYIKGFINLRGNIIPLIDARIRFKLEPIEYNDKTCIIVINMKSIMIGLIVEKIAGVENINDEDIVPPPDLGHKGRKYNKYICGMARTKDTVKLLIDPEKLMKLEDIEKIEDMQEKTNQKKKKKSPNKDNKKQ